MKKLFLTILILFVQKAAISFKDVSETSGINVSHISTPENRYIIESMSATYWCLIATAIWTFLSPDMFRSI